MLKGMRVLVVVPAGTESRGPPRVSLRSLAGRTLMGRVADIVAELDWVDRAVVSTDHPSIADAARDCGLEVPFVRPGELSGEQVGYPEVLSHAVEATENDDGNRYEVLVMLRPTSPMRRAEHVTATVRKLVDEDLDTVSTVSPTDARAHPFDQVVVDDAGGLRWWDERRAAGTAPQRHGPVYHCNDVAYALRRECLPGSGGLVGRWAGAVVLDEAIVNVDTERDLERAEALIAERDRAAGGHGAGRSTPGSLVVDIDGVLAEAVPDRDYTRAGPLRDNIARVNALYDAGWRITLYTARGSATGKDWSRLTREQLSAWGVRHHDLRLGKPAGDYYVDDRMITLQQALALSGVTDPGAMDDG